MVFNIKYLLCLSILLSLFKPRVRAEMINDNAEKKPFLEINSEVVDLNEYITNEEKRLEALKSHLMTAEECYLLCKAFYSRSDLVNTLVWSMETLHKYKVETTEEHSFTEVDVLEYIAYVHYLMGNIKSALEWTKKLLKLEPNHPRAAGNVPQYEDIIAGQEMAIQYKGDTGDETDDEKWNALHKLNVAQIHLMTASDCFELSKLFYYKKYYNHSLPWIMETLRKYKEEATKEHSFTEVEVLEYIAFTHYLMGDVKTALEWTKKLLELEPNHPRAARNVPRYEEMIARGDEKGNFNLWSEEIHEFDVDKSLQMTAADCFELGRTLYHKSEYNNSLAWNMESLRKYKNETTDEHLVNEVELLEYIAFTHYLIGDVKTALEWTNKLLKLDPNHTRAVANVPLFEKAIADKEASQAVTKKGDTCNESEDETNDEMPEFDVDKSRIMTAEECFELCQGFYFENDFDNSLAWGMAALHKYKEETNKKHSFTEVEVLEFIAFSHNMLGDTQNALEWTKKLLKLEPNHPRAAGNVPIFEKVLAEEEAATKKRGDTGDKYEDETTGNEIEEVPKFDVTKSHLMTSAACFKLCKDFYFKNDFKNSLVWSMVALHKYKVETTEEHSFTEVDVLEYIGFSHYMMGDVKTALEWTQILLNLDPYHARAVAHAPLFEKAVAEQEAANNKRLGTGVPTEDVKDEKEKPDQLIISEVASSSPSYVEITLSYEALCRGEMEITSDVAKRLFCRYMSETHQFLRLAPIKAEQVYIDPDVFLFHDVLSDDEIQVIKDLSTPRLQRATVSDPDTVGATIASNSRISKSAWLSDGDSYVVARVSQRVADMTGLSVKSAEQLQVVNYGVGGHYEPHYDFAEKNKLPFAQQDGNRIATVLFYMSDVVQGGATVFTELGLAVFPAHGSALYWRNLHPSGEGDTATRHAACPVLRGSKWVCNKWIHEGGQELTKPCHLL